MEKKCKNCKQVKNYEDFPKKLFKTKYKGMCRKCRKKIRDNNYYNRHKKQHRASSKATYYKDHRKSKEYHKKYRETNSELIAKKRKERSQTKEFKKWRKKYFNNKRKTDINYRLGCNLRSRLLRAMKLNSKNGSAVKDLGCSIEEFKQYLESKFQVGMTWKNYGHGMDKWNIDHVIPIIKFDLTDRSQFLKACNFTNLQPMWQKDNFKKNRYG